MRKSLMAMGAVAVLLSPGAARALDPRELVAMAPAMQEDMLNSMQDHLVVLDTILSHLASERYGEAAKLAEQRLTISPYDPAKAARMVAEMPPPMQDAEAGLRQAAIRLAAAARRADSQRDYAAMKEVAGALSDVTAACTGCHAHYRIR
jgi:hypothetical protein